MANGDIAPTRKVDAGRLFPWRRLAQHGFGLWCESPPAVAPAGFDALLGLRALGYDVTVATAARAAFRRHFTGQDSDAELAPAEQALLHCLLEQPRETSTVAPAAAQASGMAN